MNDLLDILARIVNRASDPRKTSADAVTTCAVPAELLKQARDLLEDYRDDRWATAEIKHATNRVFD